MFDIIEDINVFWEGYMCRVWKMNTKVLLLFLGTILFALVLQTVLFQKTSSRLIYHQAEEENFNSLKNMQDDIYNFVKDIENGIIDIYNEKELLKDLRIQREIHQMREEYYREAYNIAVTNFETSNSVVALYLYNINHEIISTYRRAVTPKHNYPEDIYESPGSYNEEITRNYVESDNTSMLISSYYNKSRKKDIIRFVLKLYNNSNVRDKIGYVVCDVDSKAIKTIMEKYNTDEEAFMWLQPTGDRPILSFGTLDKKDRSSYKNLQEEIRKGQEQIGVMLESENRVFFQVGQSKYNLGAYSIMPSSLLWQNQKVLTKNLVIIAILMLFIAVVVVYFTSKYLTKPLEKMTQTMKEIKEGNTKLRIEELQGDELGELAKSFNEMLDKIENLISNEYETKLLLHQAEYNALQAQINPHFLYNTLDTMSSIAYIQGCSQVGALCQSLSNIFRYSLDIKHPFSTVAKEIVHLKNYIYVMNVRMQDNVEYHFEIEDSVLKETIPRISIQPIVENALNHGLRNMRGEKQVEICARSLEQDTEIIVKDNGIGMPQEKIDILLEDTDAVHTRGKSIGLSNINMRIKMLYGEQYGIQIESKINVGTTVTLRVPKKKLEE